MLEKDHANLMAILDAAEKIQRFTEGISDADAFYVDEKTFDAALMNFVLIGETVSKPPRWFKFQNLNPISISSLTTHRTFMSRDV